ncbi:hypothetical protein HHK36_014049 [Tetracentron sinense]|uniref:F-box domain-containing protein n=1 Tax=Tetracentron sinense TaxID=13715 RepID=A0A834Z393_TETSI|nr:hypothetical protein HHK36_014049 [Tetracentron sinense]
MDLIPGLPYEIARDCLIRVPYNQFCTVASVCKGWKEEIELPDFHLQRKAKGLTRTVIAMAQAQPNRSSGAAKYPATPAYQLTLFEPETWSWLRLPPVNGFPDGLPLFCQFAGVGTKLVVIGGWNPATWEVSNAVFVYDFLSATWQCGAHMPGKSRSFFACASDADRMVFVAGGHDEEKNALKSAIVYDVAKDEWVPLADMEIERDECKGIFQRGKFHVIGGYRTEQQGRFERSGEAFDVATWKWGQVEEDVLKSGTCPKGCVAGDEARMYMCDSGHVVALLEEDTWQAVAELPDEVRVAPHAVMWQGKLLVIGSARHGGPHMAYVLDTKRHTWTKGVAPEEYTGHVQASCYLEI